MSACANANIIETTKNAGSIAGGASTTGLYFSTSTLLDSEDVPLGKRAAWARSSRKQCCDYVNKDSGNISAGTY